MQERKVELVSLREGLDLASPVGKALFTMLGLVAELERAWIRERVRHGIAAARRRGTHIGRRPRLDADGRARARRMHEAGQTIAHIAETLGCSRPSVQRALGILR